METLSTHLDDGLLWIRLNRPDDLNAFSERMGEALLQVFETASLDDAVGDRAAGRKTEGADG